MASIFDEYGSGLEDTVRELSRRIDDRKHPDVYAELTLERLGIRRWEEASSDPIRQRVLDLVWPYAAIHNLRVLVGEERYSNRVIHNLTFGLHPLRPVKKGGGIVEFRRYPNHIITLNSLIAAYRKPNLDPSDFDFYIKNDEMMASATFRHDPSKPLLFHNQQPIHDLEHFTGLYYLGELAASSPTSFYAELMRGVELVWARANEVEGCLLKDERMSTAIGQIDEADYRRSANKVALLYLELESQDARVLPLVYDMKLIYQTAIDIIKGVSAMQRSQQQP